MDPSPLYEPNPKSGTVSVAYCLPSILALWLLCGIDLLRTSESPDATFIASLTGLATAFGLLQGMLLNLTLNVLPRIRVVGPWLAPLIPLALLTWLADSLGVFVRLTGRHQKLALLTGGACLAGAVVGGVLVALIQRQRDGRPGSLLRLTGAAHVSVGFFFLISSLLALITDHRMYVGLYPSAHLALRIASSVLLAMALATAKTWAPLGERVFPLFVLTLFIPTALLTSDAEYALQEYSLRPFSGTLLHAARAAFDFDRDGFSALLGGGDCNDHNPHVHPAAREIPDNGIDDNCFFGDAHAKPTAVDAVPRPKGQAPMSVVLITVDTLRWDRLALNDARFGEGGKDTMPNVSRWANNAMNFSSAYSAGSWTSIALASLLRGVYARRLTWEPHYETNQFRMLEKKQTKNLRRNERITKMFPLAWHDPHKPLSFWLKRRGMTTAAVIDDSFSLMLARQLGCNEGFDRYREVNPGASLRPRNDDADTARIAIQEVKALSRQVKPFFLWVHFFGPHGPSTVHPGVRLDSNSIEDLYDEEVRYVDMQIKKLLATLDRYKKPLATFITSDHGEEITSTYRSHGTNAKEYLLRVPLIARVPGWPSGTYDKPVSHIDLVPTILALTKTPGPRDLDGIDLGPLVSKHKAPKRKTLISDSWGFNRYGRSYVDMVIAFDGKHKLVLDRRNHSFSRFSQEKLDDRPTSSTEMLSGPLMNALMGYIEETGGAVQLQD